MTGRLSCVAALFLAGPLFGQDLPRTAQPTLSNPKRHEEFIEIARRGGVDLLFLGDFVTEGWCKGPGEPLWKELYEPLRAANFGIGGDRTENVLWRVMNGELEGLSPKVIVLLIGTNNGKDSAQDVATGIAAILREIKMRAPHSKTLLLGLLPRGEKPNAAREKNDRVNEEISKLEDHPGVWYLNIGEKFLDADKVVQKEVMPDALHLSEKGYRIWAEAMSPTLKELMAPR